MTSNPHPLSSSTANWRKASYSASQTACVEVADWPTGTAIRDTQHRDLSTLTFDPAEWRAFLNTTKNNTH